MTAALTTPRSRNPAGRPKDEAKHAAILAAAAQLFMHAGFRLTSMDAVAQAANVSKLTIYSHFADKDALFKAVIDARCEQSDLRLEFASMSDSHPAETLEKIGLNFVNLVFNEDSIALHRMMESECIRHPKISELFFEAGPRQLKQAFSELLAIWHREKKLSIADTETAAAQFFALMKGEIHMKMLLNLTQKPSEALLKRHVQSGVALFLAGYAPAL